MSASADGGSPSTPTPRLCAVVVNFGAHSLIEQNLATGADPVAEVAEIIVVDNYHSAAERAAVEALCRRRCWHVVSLPTNEGFAAGCNAGIAAAGDLGAREILLVNPDARVSGAVADQLHRQLVDDPDTVVSPVITTSSGLPYFHGSRVDLRSGRMRGRPRPAAGDPGPILLESRSPERDWLSGACLAFTVDLWRRAGRMDEGYFLYWEDVDFSERCVAAGARLVLRPGLVVTHDEGATHGKGGGRARSDIYYYYNCRNRLVYGANHLGRSALLRWMIRTPAESWQILLRGGRRQILSRPSCLWATITGSIAGLLAASRRLLTVQRESQRQHHR